MKEQTLLKSILKKWELYVQKALKKVPSKSAAEQLRALKIQNGLLRAFLLLCECYFSKQILEQAELLLSKLSENLEDARKCTASLFFLNHLAPSEKLVEKKASKGATKKLEKMNILEEAEALCHSSLKEVIKQLKQIESRRIGNLLLKDFSLDNRLEFQSFIKLLNERREKLFNQVVEIIRTSQPTDNNYLQRGVEDFIALLTLFVEAGYEKGKRLLQVVNILAERLIQIVDGEKFREFLEEMEKKRQNDSRYVADVEKIRFLRTRLGVLQAHALQAFHAHLPVTLQVLKRHLPATF